MTHGVVAVHGIGEQQRRGAFLAAVVNGIADVLEESGASVVRGFKVAAEATAKLTVTPPAGKGGVTQEFEFIEAFWADAFPPPTASTVVSWLVKQGPGQIKSIGDGLRDDPGNDTAFDPDHPPDPGTPVSSTFVHWMYRIELAVLWVLSVLLWLLAFPLAPLLWFLWWLPRTPLLNPFGIFSKLLAGIHALDPFLSKSIGDTERYIQDGAWAANIRGILERSLTGFVQRDDVTDITIIAHSQGAAIAYDALAEGSPVASALASKPKRVTLVTLGSGINQVFSLAKQSNSYARKRFSLRLDPRVTGVGILPEQDLRKRFYWLDIYARMDPVPAGKLRPWIQAQAHVDPVQVKLRRVVNLDNPLRDHSNYFVNKDVVIPRLIRAIYGGEYPWPEAGIVKEKVLRRARGIAWLQIARFIILGLVTAQLALLAWNHNWRTLVMGKAEPAVLRTKGFNDLYCQLSNGTLHAREHQPLNEKLKSLSGAERTAQIEVLKSPIRECVSQSNFLQRDLGGYNLLRNILFGDIS